MKKKLAWHSCMKIFFSHIYSSKGVVAGICVKQTGRWRVTTTSRYIDPQLSPLLAIACIVIFRALHLCHLCFPARGRYRPLPHREKSGQSPLQNVSRPQTPDWKQTTVRLLVSALKCVYIISQRPCVPAVTLVMCFRLYTQVHLILQFYCKNSCQ